MKGGAHVQSYNCCWFKRQVLLSVYLLHGMLKNPSNNLSHSQIFNPKTLFTTVDTIYLNQHHPLFSLSLSFFLSFLYGFNTSLVLYLMYYLFIGVLIKAILDYEKLN